MRPLTVAFHLPLIILLPLLTGCAVVHGAGVGLERLGSTVSKAKLPRPAERSVTAKPTPGSRAAKSSAPARSVAGRKATNPSLKSSSPSRREAAGSVRMVNYRNGMSQPIDDVRELDGNLYEFQYKERSWSVSKGIVDRIE